MWHVGKVMALHDETATTRTITLEVPGWPGHIAGQHVDVRLTAADGYSAARSYSIASAPNVDGRIELTIERLPDGEVSPYLTQELTAGDPLELRGPLGGWFVWRTNQTEAIQLIARGSRIVPLMAFESVGLTDLKLVAIKTTDEGKLHFRSQFTPPLFLRFNLDSQFSSETL